MSVDERYRRECPDLEPHELIEIRGRVYRVAGFNAYGQAMLSQIRFPTDAERRRATRAGGEDGR